MNQQTLRQHVSELIGQGKLRLWELEFIENMFDWSRAYEDLQAAKIVEIWERQINGN